MKRYGFLSLLVLYSSCAAWQWPPAFRDLFTVPTAATLANLTEVELAREYRKQQCHVCILGATTVVAAACTMYMIKYAFTKKMLVSATGHALRAGGVKSMGTMGMLAGGLAPLATTWQFMQAKLGSFELIAHEYRRRGEEQARAQAERLLREQMRVQAEEVRAQEGERRAAAAARQRTDGHLEAMQQQLREMGCTLGGIEQTVNHLAAGQRNLQEQVQGLRHDVIQLQRQQQRIRIQARCAPQQPAARAA